ncbi:MAG: helical backbone metal receptor [Acidimicrobiales bacterium]
MTSADTPPGARVVSLVPSATETLLAWGITPIAVTRFCEQPHLPAVGGTKNPDIDAIVDLAPDLVVLCEEENRVEDAERLADAGLRLHTVTVRSVADVEPELDRLAAALGVPARPFGGVPARTTAMDSGLRAFVPIWRRPWMTLNHDTYGSALLAELGVTNIYADAAERYPEVDLAAVAARRPNVVMAPTEPYPFSERHRRELEAVAPVAYVDGQDLFWWGWRTPAAIARLASTVAQFLAELAT